MSDILPSAAWPVFNAGTRQSVPSDLGGGTVEVGGDPWRYVTSNKTDDRKAHIGKREESRTAKTHTLVSVFYIALCTRRQLGGAWGQTVHREVPRNHDVCPRCAALYARLQ